MVCTLTFPSGNTCTVSFDRGQEIHFARTPSDDDRSRFELAAQLLFRAAFRYNKAGAVWRQDASVGIVEPAAGAIAE